MKFEGLHIKILQSTIERLLYLLLLLMFVAIIIVGTIAYRDGQLIKENQKTNALAVKTYIACLLIIKPAPNVHIQEHRCFNNAPIVK